MAILNIGKHVLVGGEWLGVITQLDFHPKYHLVWRLDNTSPMSLLRHEDELIPVDPVFSKLLTDVNESEEDDGEATS